MLGLVWAQGADRAIGADGGIPWRLPEDLARFKELTLGATVVMGRRTWESLPRRFRPLPGRTNLVVTRSPGRPAEGATTVDGLDTALAAADTDDVWIMGGQSLYEAAIERADLLEVTEVDTRVPQADTWAPPIDATWQAASSDPVRGWHTSSTGLRYRFVTYRRAESAG